MKTPTGGDPVTLDGTTMYDEPWVPRPLPDGVYCCDLADEGPVADGPEQSTVAAAFAGGWLLDRVKPLTGPSLSPGQSYAQVLSWAVDDAWPVWEYADALLGDLGQITRQFDRPPLRVIEAKAHRDVQMAWHRDLTAPEGTVLNAMTFYSRACEGGALVLPEKGVAFAPDHLRVVVFDGQTMHGVTPFTLGPGGYRISLTFYLGEGDPPPITPG